MEIFWYKYTKKLKYIRGTRLPSYSPASEGQTVLSCSGVSAISSEKKITAVLFESDSEFEREKEIIQELEQEWIDDIICANDQVAAGALNACSEASICIPSEAAITGFGGVALSIVTTPAITTTVTPKYQMGLKASEFLFERIEGYEGPPRHEMLKAQLAIRNSTLRSAAKSLDAIVLDDRNTIYK